MAERTEIAEALEGLAVHCRPPLMSVEDRARWLADWCEDLKDFSIEAINAACSSWRMSAEAKFPRQGQFIPMIRLAAQDHATGEDEAPWRPLTDAEYAELSLTDKIRHQRILASNALDQAGPQDMHTPAAEMPEKWRFFRNRGAEHLAEADRLWRILNESKRSPFVKQMESGA